MEEILPQAHPPSRLATFLEVRAPLDWASVLVRAPQLALAPRGDGRPVMLIPGYQTSESSMRPLGKFLDLTFGSITLSSCADMRLELDVDGAVGGGSGC